MKISKEAQRNFTDYHSFFTEAELEKKVRKMPILTQLWQYYLSYYKSFNKKINPSPKIGVDFLYGIIEYKEYDGGD